MIATRRQLLLLGVLAVRPASSQDSTGPRRLILDASRAIQGGNSARFIGYFDKQAYAERPALRRAVTALLETRTAASSVDILSLVELDGVWHAEVDWLLQLTPIAGAGPIERRQETISAQLAQGTKGRWRFTSFGPTELFRVL